MKNELTVVLPQEVEEKEKQRVLVNDR